jgi:hypothetical protein
MHAWALNINLIEQKVAPRNTKSSTLCHQQSSPKHTYTLQWHLSSEPRLNLISTANDQLDLGGARAQAGPGLGSAPTNTIAKNGSNERMVKYSCLRFDEEERRSLWGETETNAGWIAKLRCSMLFLFWLGQIAIRRRRRSGHAGQGPVRPEFKNNKSCIRVPHLRSCPQPFGKELLEFGINFWDN